MTDRFKRLAPLSGVVFVALMVVALAGPDSPDSSASGTRVIAWYEAHHTWVYVSALLVCYAAAAAVLYFTTVTRYLRSAGSDLLATTTFAGGVMAAAGMLVGAGTALAVNDGPHNLAPQTVSALHVLSNDLLVPLVIGGIAIATLSMGVAMLRTMCLPKALGIITTIVGVVAFSGIASWFAFMAAGPLTLVIAGYIYQRSGRPQSVTLPDVVAQRQAADAPATEVTTS